MNTPAKGTNKLNTRKKDRLGYLGLIGRKLRDKLGARGIVLSLYSQLFLVYGVSQILGKDTVREDRFLLHLLVPGGLWGCMFIVVGVLAQYYAFKRGIERDMTGYILLLVPLSLQAASYYVSFAYFLFLDHNDWPWGILTGHIWAIFGAMAHISGSKLKDDRDERCGVCGVTVARGLHSP